MLLTVFISDEKDIVHASSHKKSGFRPCQILESFEQLYRSFVAHPQTPIKNISSVTSFDIQEMSRFNQKDLSTTQKPECLHVLVNRRYFKNPEKVALASTTTTVTYFELGQRSAVVAHILKKREVRSGEAIGLCLEKSPLAIIALLGILRAGAVYVPMETSYPVDRITQIAKAADIRFIITDDNLYNKLQGLETDLILKSTIEGTKLPEKWSDEMYTDASQPAYIMFTSGSTGTPKGVIHAHGAVSQSMIECIEKLNIAHNTRFMQSASISFDASVLEIFAPLVVGGCLCIPSQEQSREDLVSAMQKMKVTDAWLASSLASQLRPGDVPDLRSLSVGGEPASAETIMTFEDHVRFNNIYGSTEGGVWDTVKSNITADENPKNIGRGIGHVSCWIVDPSNIHKLKPIGAVGELILQSPYLAIGYLKDPERTSRDFIDITSLEWAAVVSEAALAKGRAHWPSTSDNQDCCSSNPRPEISSSRGFRTGDLAKFNTKGEIVFVGRQSGFVKVHGMRIDLREVEHAINSCLEQGRAVVVLSEAESSQVEIVAFVQTIDRLKNDLLADELSIQLTDVLPQHMIPSVFIPIEDIPMTISKKVDRQRLQDQLRGLKQHEIQMYRKGGSLGGNDDITATRDRALEISNMIADMLMSKDEDYANSLRNKNFSLKAVGLNSMQLVILTNLMRRKYGKKIRMETLQRGNLTVCDLDDLLNNGGLNTDKKRSRDLIEDLHKLTSKLEYAHLHKKTIFVTSITGFLGSQILRSLLERHEVGHIIGLVRANSISEAKQKVQRQAELGKWWQSTFEDQIEIWLGDLGEPKLGLNEYQWDRLFGKERQRLIDGIIHNGAKVNWLSSYEDLEKVNVQSTFEIISGLANMETPSPLLYVSGGYLSIEHESTREIALKLSDAPGYDQTKFVSELLVNEYNKHLDRHIPNSPKALTIIPGYIVGTKREGIAHTEDFFWRLAFSIVRLQAVSRDLGHLTVAGVDQVANLASDLILEPKHHGSKVIKCFDGVKTSQFCELLSEKLESPIQRIEHTKWMELLRNDVENADFDHPFLPVLTWFEENIRQFFESKDDVITNHNFNKEKILKSLESSVDYLIDIGYFSDGGRRAQLDNVPMFSRSKS